ncbi:MAG TPA: hypothetical protein VFZ00_19095 [Solirubrobacter sp.]|nr:hypothetical protein [Solirubrobacter sp.]
MNVLDRLGEWATTGVGSLPHTDVDQAVAHLAAAYDVPFCPQLPRLDGDMITEWLGADPGRCGWSPSRDRERPRAWNALLAALKAAPPPHRVVKLQVTGPTTLAHALGDRSLAHELAAWLAATVAEQVRALDGFDVLVMVDEPALHLMTIDAWDPLRAVSTLWGLHVCGPVPWELIGRAEPDVLSFDLSLAPPDEAVIAHLVKRGGRIAWGVVQPHRPEHGLHALQRLAGRRDAGRWSLLTPSCGSGRMSVRREHEIATALWDAAHALRSVRTVP